MEDEGREEGMEGKWGECSSPDRWYAVESVRMAGQRIQQGSLYPGFSPGAALAFLAQCFVD